MSYNSFPGPTSGPNPAPASAPVLAGCELPYDPLSERFEMPRAADVLYLPYVRVTDPHNWPSEISTSWMPGTPDQGSDLKLRVNDLRDLLDALDAMEDRLADLEDRLADLEDTLGGLLEVDTLGDLGDNGDDPELAPEPDGSDLGDRFVKNANDERINAVQNGLYRAFMWVGSPQGHEYWADVVIQLRANRGIAVGSYAFSAAREAFAASRPANFAAQEELE